MNSAENFGQGQADMGVPGKNIPDEAMGVPGEQGDQGPKHRISDQEIYERCINTMESSLMSGLVLKIGVITLLDQKMKADKPELFWSFKSAIKSHVTLLQKQAKEFNEYLEKAV